MTTRVEASKMPLKDLTRLLLNSGAHPGTVRWDELWPVYEVRTRHAEAGRFWIGFVVSTGIAVAALVVAICK